MVSLKNSIGAIVLHWLRHCIVVTWNYPSITCFCIYSDKGHTKKIKGSAQYILKSSFIKTPREKTFCMYFDLTDRTQNLGQSIFSYVLRLSSAFDLDDNVCCLSHTQVLYHKKIQLTPWLANWRRIFWPQAANNSFAIDWHMPSQRFLQRVKISFYKHFELAY